MREHVNQAASGILRKADGWARRLRARPRWLRWGLGLALIAGGFLGFLPVLGLWMLPVGLIVLSDDIGWLRHRRRKLQVWLLGRILGLRNLRRRPPTDRPPCPQRP